MKTLYLLSLGAKNALRRREALGSAAVFAAAVAAAVAIDAVAAGASRNALAAFERRSGGEVFLRGLERSESGRLVELGRSEEVSAALAALPEGSLARERPSFPARLSLRGKKAAAVARGIDFDAEGAAIAALDLVAGDPAAARDGTGIVIEAKAAEALGASPGDELILDTRDARGRATAWPFRVAAVAREPDLLEDGSAWIDVGAARSVLGYAEDELGCIAIATASPRETAAELYEALGRGLPGGIGLLPRKPEGAANARWDDTRSQVASLAWKGRAYYVSTVEDCVVFPLRALGACEAAARALVALLICLAAAGASSSFRMIALDREREIGILRAIGLTAKDSGFALASEAVVAATAAGAAGAACGLVAVAALALARFAPGGSLSIFLDSGKLAPVPRPGAALVAIVACAAAAAIGAIGPARKASRSDPARAFGEGA